VSWVASCIYFSVYAEDDAMSRPAKPFTTPVRRFKDLSDNHQLFQRPSLEGLPGMAPQELPISS
jgi:hypothetical protein